MKADYYNPFIGAIVGYLIASLSRHFLIPLSNDFSNICLTFGLILLVLAMIIMFMRVGYRAQHPVLISDSEAILGANKVIQDSLLHFAIFAGIYYYINSNTYFGGLPKHTAAWFFLGRFIFILGSLFVKTFDSLFVMIGIWVNIWGYVFMLEILTEYNIPKI